jgi:hypothetical protein
MLVPLLVLRDSKLPVTMSLKFLCNSIRFVVEVSTMGGRPTCLAGRLLLRFAVWFAGCVLYEDTLTLIYDVLRGPKMFFVGSSSCVRSLGSVDVDVGMHVVFDFLACSSEGFRLRLLCSQNSSVDCCWAGRILGR